jgi:hypothetical protein
MERAGIAGRSATATDAVQLRVERGIFLEDIAGRRKI